ncbi:hypothetical protein [Agrobacterium sp.]|uniref:hypothetical protein n=1 Tax=Agrobacterium sp. TaxID=361 RepID=UPI0025C4CB94|nr:hypothetical protein [Agrobacterium sp.]MCD4663152.1 hypothetical protein [Agrobacterium sp.]
MADIISFPTDKVALRAGEPLLFDSNGRRMQLFAYQYCHAEKTWGLTLWAYSWEDAEARLASITAGLTLEGQIVSVTEGDI